MGSEDQALTVHSKKIRRDYHHSKGKNSHKKDNPSKSNRDISKYRCITCDETGHFVRYFLSQEGQQENTSCSHCRG